MIVKTHLAAWDNLDSSGTVGISKQILMLL
jgi:hypothetical protein